MDTIQRDIVVVGAGPAGSAVSHILARQGLRVTMVDKAVFPRNKPCGDYVNPGAVAILADLGLLMPVLQENPAMLHGLKLSSYDGRPVRVFYPPPNKRLCPLGLGISRRVLDNVLLNETIAAGVDFREGWRVDEPLIEDGFTRGVRGNAGGHDFEIRARLLLAADGARSTISRKLALDTQPEFRRWGFTARYRGIENTEAFAEMHTGPPGYCGISPDGQGEANVSAVVGEEKTREAAGDKGRFLTDLIEQIPGLAGRFDRAVRTTEVQAVGPMGHKTVHCTGPGFMLVGDAARFYDPFTGQGVYFALRSAQLAAATATKAFQSGDFSQNTLANYEKTRTEEFSSVLFVARAIQFTAARTRLLDYAVSQMGRQPDVASALIGVTANIVAPRRIMSPAYLFRLASPTLRPPGT